MRPFEKNKKAFKKKTKKTKYLVVLVLQPLKNTLKKLNPSGFEVSRYLETIKKTKKKTKNTKYLVFRSSKYLETSKSEGFSFYV